MSGPNSISVVTDYTLAVPAAFDTQGELCLPEDALKQASYHCPDCRGAVRLRRGTKRRPHFYHLVHSTCTGETALHLAAKRLLCTAINRRVPLAFDTPRPCGHRVQQPLPDGIVRAEEEAVVDPFRLDVGLFGAMETLLAAVEIVVSHPVTDEKAQELSVPWVEVEAIAVVDTQPHFLTGSVADAMPTWVIRAKRVSPNWSLGRCETCAKATPAKVPSPPPSPTRPALPSISRRREYMSDPKAKTWGPGTYRRPPNARDRWQARALFQQWGAVWGDDPVARQTWLIAQRLLLDGCMGANLTEEDLKAIDRGLTLLASEASRIPAVLRPAVRQSLAVLRSCVVNGKRTEGMATFVGQLAGLQGRFR